MITIEDRKFLKKYNQPNCETSNYIDMLYRNREFIKDREGKYLYLQRSDVDLQVTQRCNLDCTYCFQQFKNDKLKDLSVEDGKKAIDILLGNSEKNHYFYQGNIDVLRVFLMGGEPLLVIDTIDILMDYLVQRMIELNHPWLNHFCIYLVTNGLLYFDPKVQKFIDKYKNKLNITFSIDGDKKSTDKCRSIDPYHKSNYSVYDKAVEAFRDWRDKRGYHSTPAIHSVISEANISGLYDSTIHLMKNLGIHYVSQAFDIHGIWDHRYANICYHQFKQVADYILNNDMEEDYHILLFDPYMYIPLEETNLCNACTGVGGQVGIGSDGNFYPCYGYTECAMGDTKPRMILGNVDRGIGITDSDKQNISWLQSINRRTLSTNKCFYCPIASGCRWCNAYGYKLYGSPNIRPTNLCNMQHAMALVSAYYWNSLCIKHDNEMHGKRIHLNIDKEKAIKIIGKSEYEYIMKLQEGEK